jgi:hypothetical protein
MKNGPEKPTWSFVCERPDSFWSHVLGVGMNCPTRGWLEETNSWILVGLDDLGIRTRCLEEKNELTWFERRDNCGVRVHRYLMVGIDGNDGDGYYTGRSRNYSYQLIEI